MRRACFVAMLPVALCLVAGSLVLNQGRAESEQGAIATPARTVEMVIDYGDGVQLRFTALNWKKDMTVLDAVTAAGAHPHGVKSSVRGAGANAFVTQIGDLKNEGGGVKSRNWLFSVNDAESEVGIGAAPLKPGDVILWRFGLPANNSNAK